jgi:hypothetical protein
MHGFPPSPTGRLVLLGVLAVAAAAFLGRHHLPLTPATAEAAEPEKRVATFAEVRPWLEMHCLRCHGSVKPKAGIDLSTFTDEQSIQRQRKLWRRVLTQVETLEMPPAGARPLAAEQRDQLTAWLKHTLRAADPDNPDPGPSPIRRLSRAQYDRTLRDLLGLPFSSGSEVGMPDDAGQGYDTRAEALTLPPVLLEKYFSAADQALAHVSAGARFRRGEGNNEEKASRAAYDQLFLVRPCWLVSKHDAATVLLSRFLPRAFRRPVEPREVVRYVRLADQAMAGGADFESGVGLAVKAALVSPHFLFRLEKDQQPMGSERSYRISDHELAVRLSYFLWSSMPDEQLRQLADQGRLGQPAVLEAEVRRLLADPKARALSEDFAAQWLQLRKVADARPSTEYFPTFTPSLRQAMVAEALTFFDMLREEDRNILELLDADYAYVNADLAKHYGLPAVEGPLLRKVALRPQDRRGGLLGMGAVLSMTSHTSRTSPTLRGRYVLEVILGTPPPPPPPDAGKLDEQMKKGQEPKTFRELMAQHAQASCAGCHAKIDPLGYGLENFDAVGRWRLTQGKETIDASGKLPTGERFDGPDGLKKLLWQRKEAFTRNLAGQMLTYALGRDLDFPDEPIVEALAGDLRSHDYHFSTLVLGIVRSYPFQHRRNTDASP